MPDACTSLQHAMWHIACQAVPLSQLVHCQSMTSVGRAGCVSSCRLAGVGYTASGCHALRAMPAIRW